MTAPSGEASETPTADESDTAAEAAAEAAEDSETGADGEKASPASEEGIDAAVTSTAGRGRHRRGRTTSTGRDWLGLLSPAWQQRVANSRGLSEKVTEATRRWFHPDAPATARLRAREAFAAEIIHYNKLVAEFRQQATTPNAAPRTPAGTAPSSAPNSPGSAPGYGPATGIEQGERSNGQGGPYFGPANQAEPPGDNAASPNPTGTLAPAPLQRGAVDPASFELPQHLKQARGDLLARINSCDDLTDDDKHQAHRALTRAWVLGERVFKPDPRLTWARISELATRLKGTKAPEPHAEVDQESVVEEAAAMSPLDVAETAESFAAHLKALHAHFTEQVPGTQGGDVVVGPTTAQDALEKAAAPSALMETMRKVEVLREQGWPDDICNNATLLVREAFKPERGPLFADDVDVAHLLTDDAALTNALNSVEISDESSLHRPVPAPHASEAGTEAFVDPHHHVDEAVVAAATSQARPRHRQPEGPPEPKDTAPGPAADVTATADQGVNA